MPMPWKARPNQEAVTAAISTDPDVGEDCQVAGLPSFSNVLRGGVAWLHQSRNSFLDTCFHREPSTLKQSGKHDKFDRINLENRTAGATAISFGLGEYVSLRGRTSCGLGALLIELAKNSRIILCVLTFCVLPDHFPRADCTGFLPCICYITSFSVHS